MHGLHRSKLEESVGADVLNAQLSNSIILFDKERAKAPPCAPSSQKQASEILSRGGLFSSKSNVIVFFGFE